MASESSQHRASLEISEHEGASHPCSLSNGEPPTSTAPACDNTVHEELLACLSRSGSLAPHLEAGMARVRISNHQLRAKSHWTQSLYNGRLLGHLPPQCPRQGSSGVLRVSKCPFLSIGVTAFLLPFTSNAAVDISVSCSLHPVWAILAGGGRGGSAPGKSSLRELFCS